MYKVGGIIQNKVFTLIKLLAVIVVCFKINNNECCLKNEITDGEHTSQHFETNMSILKEAYADVLISCYFSDDYSYCNA